MIYSLEYLNNLYDTLGPEESLLAIKTTLSKIVTDIRTSTDRKRRLAHSRGRLSPKRKIKTSKEQDFVEIIKCLNKITDKTYNKLSQQIIHIVLNGTDEFFREFSDVMFTNVRESLVDVYACLYDDVRRGRKEIVAVLKAQYARLLADIEETPDVTASDYDTFCMRCKLTESRHSQALLLCALHDRDVVCDAYVEEFLRSAVEIVTRNIIQQGKLDSVNECASLIRTLMLNERTFRMESARKIQYPIIAKLSQSKVSEYSSLTNKSLFKFKDIYDKYEN